MMTDTEPPEGPSSSSSSLISAPAPASETTTTTTTGEEEIAAIIQSCPIDATSLSSSSSLPTLTSSTRTSDNILGLNIVGLPTASTSSTTTTATTSGAGGLKRSSSNDGTIQAKHSKNTHNSTGGDDEDSNTDLFATLQCSICQQVLYNCVSLDCMHSFCASCYTQWSKRSKTCPDCRQPFTNAKKNFVVQSMVNTLLKYNPHYDQRTDKEKEELDAIVAQSATTTSTTARVSRFTDSDYSGSDESPSGSDSEEEEEEQLCPLCPNYDGPAVDRAALASSSSCDATNPSHILCFCCSQCMPSSSQEAAVMCVLCSHSFCHQLWGCSCASPSVSPRIIAPNSTAPGCLNRFNAPGFDSIPVNLYSNPSIGSNAFERQVMIDWLTDKNQTVTDLWSSVLQKVASDQLSVPAEYQRSRSREFFGDDALFCRDCHSKVFCAFVREFRKTIDKQELRPEHSSRPDCYWGYECRTQFHKPTHAQNYNHICIRTRS